MEGRALQGDLAVAAGHREPVHLAGLRRGDDPLQPQPHLGARLGGGLEFLEEFVALGVVVLLGALLEGLDEGLQGLEHPLQGCGELRPAHLDGAPIGLGALPGGQVYRLVVLAGGAALHLVVDKGAEGVKEGVQALQGAVHLPLAPLDEARHRVAGALGDALLPERPGNLRQDPTGSVADGVADAGEKAVQVLAADGDAELVGGYALQVVGLVDDQVAVLGQYAALAGQVGEEQGVVDHHEVGALGPGAGPVEKAAALPAVGALVAEAGLRGGLHLAPHPHVAVHQHELRPVAGGGLWEPGQDLGQAAELGGRELPAAAEHVQAPEAEIVGAPLEERRTEGQVQDAPDVGDVLVEQLVLEVDGVRRDHHPLVVLERQVGSGQEVGQRLAGAGAGLHQKVGGQVQGLGHGAHHLHLLGAVLVARKGLLEHAARGHQGGEGVAVHGLDGVVGRQGRELVLFAARLALRAGRPGLADGKEATGRLAVLGGDVAKHAPQGPVVPGGQARDLVQEVRVPAGDAVHQGEEQVFGSHRIVEGAVVLGEVDAQVLAQAGQAVASGAGQRDVGQLKGVDGQVAHQQAVAAQELQVHLYRMGHDGVVARQGQDLPSQ